MERLGVVFASLLAAALLAGPAVGAAPDPKQPQQFQRGALIRFEGMIDSRLEKYLERKLDVARKRKTDLVIIEIDSPGGEVDASLDIARMLRDLNWAHTVAYIPREALSGAAIVALGTDDIIIDSNAMMGDAGPIFMDENFLFRHAPEKFRSNLAANVRQLAQAGDRPPALAEAMVDMDLLVYRVKNRDTGKITYMSEDEIQSAADPKVWERGPMVHESRKGNFLEVSGERAVELLLAQGLADSREDVQRRYGLKGDLLILEPTGVDTAVYILNLGIVTGLLFVIGLIALYIEFSSPGIGVGGLIALLCFMLFFWSRFLGGTADWLEIVLFVAGIAFLGVELFLLPGFGVAGLTGILLIVVSLVLAGQRFIIPQTGRELGMLTSSLLVIAVSGGVFGVAAVFLSRYFGSLPVFSRFMLEPPDRPMTDAEAGSVGGGHGATDHPVVGAVGVANSQLRPAGKARFGDRYLDVVADGDFIDKNTPVRIVEIHGNRVVVIAEQGNEPPTS